MKFLLAVLMALPFSAFSNVAGTWAWNATGCRDGSLSAESHISQAKGLSGGIEASVLWLNPDRSAEMTITIAGETQRKTGTYSIADDRVVITDPTFNEKEPALTLHIVEDELLILDETTISDKVCGDGNYFVYVFGKV